MKKGIRFFCYILTLCVVFVFGWRVMPKVWPSIKDAVVYPIFPQMKPAPTATPEPYVPHSNAALEDPIGKTESLIYYFYKDYCPWCRQLEPLTSGLPKEITLPDGTKSKVQLQCLNKAEEDKLQIITDYYNKHSIPEERRLVPAIVIGDQYLFGANEIVPGLMEALMNGEGLKTELLGGQERH